MISGCYPDRDAGARQDRQEGCVGRRRSHPREEHDLGGREPKGPRRQVQRLVYL